MFILIGKERLDPIVTNYMETVFNEFGLPQHIDFRVHYRVSRNLFVIILQDIFANGTGPYDAIEPPKQRLVCLWYLANMSSMRQVGHIFNPLKSSIHKVVIQYSKLFNSLRKG